VTGAPWLPLVVDEFAGPGGWDEGVRPLGLAPRGIDLNVDACDTARAAGHYRHRADVALLDPRDTVDPWGRCRGQLGSPPCPGWTVAGKGRARRDAALVLTRLAPVRTRRDLEQALVELRPAMEHEETLLALEPLRWALALTPSWLAWEQVREVLPLWEACAVVLRRIGYTVATGVLRAEQYGVPQTRRRAVLVARAPWFTRDHGPARLPVPTHSRYHEQDPARLDEGVKPWASMRDALPYGYDPLAGWYLRSNYGTGGDPRKRGRRTLDQPAPTVTSKINRNRWIGPDGSSTPVTLEQASLLQTFPAGYPWQGNATAKWQQVGDAVPPLLARAIVAEVAAITDPLR
jgi:DNA (cytosine-5)-methyltransferase 1